MTRIMDQRRWDEVRVVFDALVELDEEDRTRRLHALGTTDPRIRDAVVALLSADADVDARLEYVESAFLDPRVAAPKTVPDPYGLSGRHLSRFRVEETLGVGGMGVVYRAEDLQLCRAVALKFLLPDLARDSSSKSRFLREARAIAALNHPNVCAIYEVAETSEGVPFFAMPLYPGETLQTRLLRERAFSTREARDIARQIAQGLACAHEAGIVHRDLKPGNVMLLPDGSVKLLDFGVAKAPDQTSSVSGSLVGTVAYMSPEQLRGDVVDARTDLWSLGVVLFEMVTGTRPLPGTSPFHRDAESSSADSRLPVHVRPILERLLNESVDRRYRTAAEVVKALEENQPRDEAAPGQSREAIRSVVRLRRGAIAAIAIGALAAGVWRSKPGEVQPARIRSLVVLPFENLAGGPEQDYLVAGLHEGLTAELSRISALRTISRGSALRFRESGKSLGQIARELDVDGIVEGSADRSADSISLNVRLLLPDDRQLWARAFDGEVSDFLKVLNEATKAIAEQAGISLTPAERARLATARRVNAVSHGMYLRGMHYAKSFTPEGLASGIGMLQDAIRTDSANPLPYAALARLYAYSAVGHSNAVARRKAFSEAKALALKAIQLDETSAEAHGALGAIHLFHDWDWAGAEREFRHAISLDPSSASAHWGYALYLTAVQRIDQAIAENIRAHKLDPFSTIIIGDVAVRYYLAGQYDEAIQWAERALDLEPSFPPALWALGVAHREKGSYGEAIKAHEAAAAGNPALESHLAVTYARAGRPAAARQLLSEMDDGALRHSAFQVAQVHVALGEREEGLRWLEIAYDEHHPWLHWIRLDPILASIRSEPRYLALVRRLRLPGDQAR